MLLLEITRLARRFARHIVTAREVDDLVQDVVLRCLVGIREGRWNGRVAPLPVIIGHIVRCRAVDALRRRQCTAEREAEFRREVCETSHAWMAPDAVAEERELKALHAKALASLSPACRRAYVMVREEGLSYTQAARIDRLTGAFVSQRLDERKRLWLAVGSSAQAIAYPGVVEVRSTVVHVHPREAVKVGTALDTNDDLLDAESLSDVTPELAGDAAS
jgi:RNA polymerase sigma-70 factor (ECF subfamily)